MAQNPGTTADGTTAEINLHDTLDPGEAILPDSVLSVMQAIVSVPNGSVDTQTEKEFDVGIGTVIVVALILVWLIRMIIAFFPFVMSIGFITLLFMFF